MANEEEADTALRRVRPLHVVSDPKVPTGQRASSAAFTDDADGSSMSVYMRSIVVALKLSESATVDAKPSGWGVAAIPSDLLEAEEQTVRLDPIVGAEVPHPCDAAHAEVDGDKHLKSRRDRIARHSPLTYVVP